MQYLAIFLLLIGLLTATRPLIGWSPDLSHARVSQQILQIQVSRADCLWLLETCCKIGSLRRDAHATRFLRLPIAPEILDQTVHYKILNTFSEKARDTFIFCMVMFPLPPFNHQIINSPTLSPVSLPGSVCLVSPVSQFQTNSISSSPQNLMLGKCLLLFPEKRRAKNVDKRVPTTFYETEGKGYCGVVAVACPELKLEPHILTKRCLSHLTESPPVLASPPSSIEMFSLYVSCSLHAG